VRRLVSRTQITAHHGCLCVRIEVPDALTSLASGNRARIGRHQAAACAAAAAFRWARELTDGFSELHEAGEFAPQASDRRPHRKSERGAGDSAKSLPLADLSRELWLDRCSACILAAALASADRQRRSLPRPSSHRHWPKAERLQTARAVRCAASARSRVLVWHAIAFASVSPAMAIATAAIE